MAWLIVLVYYIVPPLLVFWLVHIKVKNRVLTITQPVLFERWKKLFWVVLGWSIAGKVALSSLSSLGVDFEKSAGVGLLILATQVAYLAIAVWFSILSFQIAPLLGGVRWAWVVSSVLSWLHLYATITFGICGWKAIRKRTSGSSTLVKRGNILIFAEKTESDTYSPVLQNQGYWVQSAENYEEAREELLGQECDLIIATTWTWRLPSLFEMIPKIKIAHPKVKVLLLSAWEELPASIKEKVAADSVMKVTCELVDLLDRISSLLVEKAAVIDVAVPKEQTG